MKTSPRLHLSSAKKEKSSWVGRSAGGRASRLALVFLTLLADLGNVRADSAIVMEQDFSTENLGAFSAAANLVPWTGVKSNANRGDFKIDTAPGEGSDPGKPALVFYASGEVASSSVATILTIKTAGFGASGKGGSCLYHFLIPIGGDGSTFLHYGGIWRNNVADIVLEKGSVAIIAQKTSMKAGNYEVDKWNDLRVDFDFEKKVFSLFLNDQQLSRDIPWNDSEIKSIDYMSITGNTKAVAAGTPILYLEKISISSN